MPDLSLVRPLLATSRAEIEAYCAAHKLAPRYDRSNEDTTFFRNRLRHELLPLLETYNPAIREVLAHTAEVLAGEHAVLRLEVEAAWRNVVLSASGCAAARVRQEPPPPVMLSGSTGQLPLRQETPGPVMLSGSTGQFPLRQETPGPVMLSGSTGQFPLRQGISEASRAQEFLAGGSEDQPSPHIEASSAGSVHFDLPAWRGLPLGLQRATIREAIHCLRRSLRNINWEHVERAVWLAREGGTGQAATLAAGLELQIGYRTLRIAAEGAAWQVDVPQVNGPLPSAGARRHGDRGRLAGERPTAGP